MARPSRPNANERARRKMEMLAEVRQLGRRVQLLEADVARAQDIEDARRLLGDLAERREELHDAEAKLDPAHARAMQNRARRTAAPQHSGAE